MRFLSLAVAILLGTGLLTRAQEVPEISQRTWSIELGTGVIPFPHFVYSNTGHKDGVGPEGTGRR